MSLSKQIFALVLLSVAVACLGAAELRVDHVQSGSSHWAWGTPAPPGIPPVKLADWPRNAIDRFILARLEQQGIEPASEADRYTLIRRVSLDLIGLPPTPEQVAQFVQDDRPDAYERVVDRLLADPGFGERWARMWLDLARYADSKGYGSDPLRTIWRYRDWVIDAFNRNVPYDQFTVDQLAGDLLPDATHHQLLATAFHRNTMANDEGGTDDEQFRVEAVKDRVDSTMQIWMGVTMGCAKCHSHKYDPISQHEYYSFFAFFNQSEDADRGDEEPRLRSASREQQRRLDDIQDQLISLNASIETPSLALADSLRAAQAEWERSVAEDDGRWVVLDPIEHKSASGTVFTELDDHSLLASGANPPQETYTVTARTELSGITAVRLELLADSSLPGGGPGRGGGNFVLNDFRVATAAAGAKPPAGRYVRIEIPGTHRILSLAEVQVFGSPLNNDQGTPEPDGQIKNLALAGKASQSSTDYDGPASLAIDGNTNGHYFEAKSTTHTRAEDNPWWELDLNQTAQLDHLIVWNRTDGSVGTRLVNFRLAILDDERKTVWESKVAEAPNPSTRLSTAGPVPLAIKAAASDFDQADFPVAKAIDSDASAKSGWAIAPEFGKGHVAQFEFSSPVSGTGGSELTFTLVQNYGQDHTLGRFRFTATAASQPSKPLPARVRDLLAVAPPDRSTEQAGELARYYRSIAPLLEPVRAKVVALERDLKELEKQVPLIPVMRELPAEKRRPTHVLVKSNFLLPGDAVEPAVPDAFPPMPGDSPRNRLGLARWLVSTENPLTARVAANRFWSQLFGRGLVETEEDFGTQGLPPSHPELLDWLALEFMSTAKTSGPADNAGAWDMKRLLRLIVTSATYRQSSVSAVELERLDPDNRLLARGPRHRLEAEMVRDQALALAGLLSRKSGGASVYPPQPPGLWRAAFNGERTWATSTGDDRYRRGLYTFWRRTVPYPSMATFDAPSREICTVRRSPTNTPLQAFVTLNDPVYVEAAQALARRIVHEGGKTHEERAEYGLALCLGRPPSRDQVHELVRLVVEELARFTADPSAAQQLATDPLGPVPDGLNAPELAAWTVAGNVLLNLDGVLSKR